MVSLFFTLWAHQDKKPAVGSFFVIDEQTLLRTAYC